MCSGYGLSCQPSKRVIRIYLEKIYFSVFLQVTFSTPKENIGWLSGLLSTFFGKLGLNTENTAPLI
jgi:hypothetical protein